MLYLICLFLALVIFHRPIYRRLNKIHERITRKPFVITGTINRFSSSDCTNGVRHYQFIEVDGKRYDDFYLSEYNEDTFRTGLGKHVELSVFPISKKALLFCAMRLENKVIERSKEESVRIAFLKLMNPVLIIFYFFYALIGSFFFSMTLFLPVLITDNSSSSNSPMMIALKLTLIPSIASLIYIMVYSPWSEIKAIRTVNIARKAFDN
jgi:hypothetical protein